MTFNKHQNVFGFFFNFESARYLKAFLLYFSDLDDEVNDHRKEIVPTIDYPLLKAMFRIIRPIHGWKVSSGILPSDLGSILTFGLVIMYLIPQVVGGVILFGLFSQLGLLGVI